MMVEVIVRRSTGLVETYWTPAWGVPVGWLTLLRTPVLYEGDEWSLGRRSDWLDEHVAWKVGRAD